MRRKYESLDLMKLYSQSSPEQINSVLTKHCNRNDVESLKKLLYGLQAGMSDLEKKKLVTEEMILWYCRIEKAIITAAKIVFRKVYPNPLDNPTKIVQKSATLDQKTAKRMRDRAFQRFLKEASF